MSNRLIESNSPYLLQHKENPVDWYPWGELALEKAKKEDKPIFLSIGYAACHWCHVMAHESFEDEDIATIMNEHFVNIKVDREERPDIDNIYMNAVVAMTGQGGWPLSVFLTPDGEPFYGGTYFPPTPRYNMPSFRDVLLSIARTWQEDREKVLRIGDQLTENLASQSFVKSSAKKLDEETMEKASMAIAQSYDWKHGGWGQAPKFPQPMLIEFLLNRAARGDKFGLEMATHALSAMAKGGMYDVIGGGFARYSTDNKWLLPHFEKMLYDNAQLASGYLYAYKLTGEDDYRNVCEETLDFVARELRDPQGGFYSSLDADSEGEEGKFYVWTYSELRELLGDSADFELFARAFGVTKEGNFEGANSLQRVVDDELLAGEFERSHEQIEQRLAEIKSRLFDARSKRVRPGTDDKVLVSWNALALAAFSDAGRYLGREDYKELAIRNGEFLIANLYTGHRLLRSWRDGKAQHNAYLEDYAALILAFISLYQTDPNTRWFSTAAQLTAEMIDHFRDPQGGFFDTRDDHESLITRPKDIQDNATPSGNALAANALLKMAAYTGRGDWRDVSETAMASVQELVQRHPLGFGKWLCAIDFALSPVHEVAILGDPNHVQTQQLIDTLWRDYRPHLIAAISDFPPPVDAPPLLEDRHLVDELPTAYVCQHFFCQQPVNDSQSFANQLQS